MYETMAYLQRRTNSWAFNRHRLQGLTSKTYGHHCGHYALTELGDSP